MIRVLPLGLTLVEAGRERWRWEARAARTVTSWCFTTDELLAMVNHSLRAISYADQEDHA